MERVIERVQVPVWGWLAVTAAAFMVYVGAFDNGAVLQSAAETVHELFHDGRHFLGVPCH